MNAKYLRSGAVLLVFLIPFGHANAGEPSSFVQGVAEAPPETQIAMLRIVLDDVLGTPEKLRASFTRACDTQAPAPEDVQGNAASASSARPETASTKKKGLTLAALCARPVRERLIAILSSRALRGPAASASATSVVR